jgi:uncharacterized ferredoxin-like protein
MLKKEEEIRDNIMEIVAHLMALSARTAPKSAGIDDIEIVVITGEEKDKLAKKMKDMSKEKERNFIRDAIGVEKASCVILVGVKGGKSLGLNCGACGFVTCEGFKKRERQGGKDYLGPSCAFKLVDLGIAIGSAVKTAGILNADNRVMYRIGTAARKLGYTVSDVVFGIPIASSGKNPFFDRVFK